MTIECIDFRSHVKGSLQGFANLWIPKMGLEIFGCTLHMKDGKRWLNLPSREYVDKETGETKYMSVIRFRDKDHHTIFSERAKRAIDEWCVRNAKNEAEVKSGPEEEEVPF